MSLSVVFAIFKVAFIAVERSITIEHVMTRGNKRALFQIQTRM
jgi:hypothetical protein